MRAATIRAARAPNATIAVRTAAPGVESGESILPLLAVSTAAAGTVEAVIPGQVDGTIVRYQIRARGDSGAVRFVPMVTPVLDDLAMRIELS